ncbi:D-methionine transport system ATP-binding protein [Alkalibacterium subtropicum]|uniref:D-methionine transport system ATP-binding protein n=1 Tax=Alkalibacterium subtropicum TaxID=753702 RepID=A0A1I1L5N1_9LACT|nr:ATP-binding cassette domain-containing protein [Alkalibacterium subtropicum]SFC68357.1 D-methionine transport system ATP-binding protein [Alkalibacterium subtropicum]
MIEFDHITKTFKEKDRSFTALSDITLSIHEGEAFGVIGESGAGKSTLLRLINALEKPTKGSVTIEGVAVAHLSKADLRDMQKRIGMIFQQFNLLNNKTVAENVHLPLELHDYPDPLTTEEVLQFVGLEDKKNSYPSQLSGGQKQRVGIARALITRPDILLCDEPTSALDQNTTEEIVEVLKKAHKEFKMTIVVVTHELPVIKELCQRAAIMDQGEVREVIGVKRSDERGNVKPYHERAIEVLSNG